MPECYSGQWQSGSKRGVAKVEDTVGDWSSWVCFCSGEVRCFYGEGEFARGFRPIGSGLDNIGSGSQVATGYPGVLPAQSDVPAAIVVVAHHPTASLRYGEEVQVGVGLLRRGQVDDHRAVPVHGETVMAGVATLPLQRRGAVSAPTPGAGHVAGQRPHGLGAAGCERGHCGSGEGGGTPDGRRRSPLHGR